MEGYSVVIVGMGPAGVTAAILLGQYGIKTLAIEKEPSVYFCPRAAAIDDEVVRAFQNLDRADGRPGLNINESSKDLIQRNAQLLNRCLTEAEEEEMEKHHNRESVLKTWQAAAGSLLWELPSRFREQNGYFTLNFIHQPGLEEKLRSVLQTYSSVDSLLGWRVTDILKNENDEGRLWRVKIVNRDEEIRFVETDFVLGCDGGSSDVRHIMGIPFRGSSYTSQKWFVIDATIDEDLQQNLDLGRTSVHPSSAFTAAPRRDGHAQVVPQFQFICDPKRSGAQMALANGHYRWEFIALPDPHRAGKLETDEYLSRPEVLMKLLKTRGITEEVFKTHIHPNIIRTVIYTFQSRSAEKWGIRCESTSPSTGNVKKTTSSRGGGVFLLGDAAHLLPPFTGQGMCAGIRDAFNISWKIHYVVNNKASPSILDSYEIERRSHVDRVRRMSVLLGSLIMTRNPTLARMRDWLAYTLQSSKVIVSFINGNDIFRPLTYFWDGLLGSDFVEDSRHWLTRTLRSWQTALLLRFSPVGDIFIQPKVYVLTPERNHHHCKDRVVQELPLDEVLARDGRFSMVVRVRDGDNATHPEELLGPDSLRFWKGLGLKVVMVVDSPKQVRTQPERAEDTNGIESVWVQDIQGHVRTYCSSHNCEIALVRPDRIVFAVLAMDARQLNNLSTEVAQSLTSPSCHAVWRSASKRRNGQLWQFFLYVFLLALLLYVLF